MRIDKKNFEKYEEPKKIELSNPDIEKLWNQILDLRKELIPLAEKGAAYYDKYQKKYEKVKKLEEKVGQIQTKLAPLVQEELEGKLEEFDILQGIDKDGGKMVAKIAYAIDEWVKNYREQEKAKEDQHKTMQEAAKKADENLNAEEDNK